MNAKTKTYCISLYQYGDLILKFSLSYTFAIFSLTFVNFPMWQSLMIYSDGENRTLKHPSSQESKTCAVMGDLSTSKNSYLPIMKLGFSP